MPPLFAVDPDKCARDGLCAAECPIGVISMKEQLPTPADRAEELCLRCGHCVAVCPSGAISLRDAAADACPPLRRDWLPGPEQTEHFLRSRRSIRRYKQEPLDRAVLARAIEMARYAPSGHNSQPVQWLVLYEKDQVREAGCQVIAWMRNLLEKHPQFGRAMLMDRIVSSWESGLDMVFWDAPHVIVAHAAQSLAASGTACVTALAYLELAAPSLGFGTCWSGFLTAAAGSWKPLKEFLALPHGHACSGALMAGFPRFSYHRLPARNAPNITWR